MKELLLLIIKGALMLIALIYSMSFLAKMYCKNEITTLHLIILGLSIVGLLFMYGVI